MKLFLFLASAALASGKPIPDANSETRDIAPSKDESVLINEDEAQLDDGLLDIQLNNFRENGVVKYDQLIPAKAREGQIETPDAIGRDTGDPMFVEEMDDLIDSKEPDDPALVDRDEADSEDDFLQMENILKSVVDTPELKEVERELENIIIGGKADLSEIVRETFEETQIGKGELLKNDLAPGIVDGVDEGYLSKISLWLTLG